MEKTTDGRTITETDIVMFSYFSGDWTFLHRDKEASAKSIFGERIAHGYLTLSVSLGLMVRSGAIDTNAFIALKSIENVKFFKPVKIGDTITVTYTSVRDEIGDDSVDISALAKVFNQQKECVMEFRTIHRERIKKGENGK